MPDTTHWPADLAYREAEHAGDLQPLIAAGNVLASVAEPADEIEFSAQFAEIALTLRLVGQGLELAEERAEEAGDAAVRREEIWELRPRPPSDVRKKAIAETLRKERAVAIRTAKRALIDLSKTIGQMEQAAALAQLRTEG